MSDNPSAKEIDVVVVGGGQAGLMLSYYLTLRGINHVVLERDRAFSAWRNRWEGFRTNTPNWMNTLPVLPPACVPSDDPLAFGTRDEMVTYFDQCLAEIAPPLISNTNVRRISSFESGLWTVDTDDGLYRARCVALCNGAMSEPSIPATSDAIAGSVPQIHSSQYRRPEQIETDSVLIVGSASSGVQICRLLGESGRFDRLHMSVSHVTVLPERILGFQAHRFIHALGLFDVRSRSLLGRLMYSGLETRGDPIMRPTPDDLSKIHGVNLFSKFDRADGSTLRFTDGQSLPTDDLTIIWCTGFKGDYSMLENSEGVLNSDGSPIHLRGVAHGASGLFFVGLRHQHTVASHDIYGVAKDAEFVADRINDRLVGRAGIDASENLFGGNSAEVTRRDANNLRSVPAECCVCGTNDAHLIGNGTDYEYETSPEVFHAYRCNTCETVYLNPRPDVSEFARIYPDDYHTLEFSEDNYSFVHRVRSRLEARRLLKYCHGIPPDARILDVGCGDGFHLRLLREYGRPDWRLAGIDLDPRAIDIAIDSGLNVRLGSLEEAGFPENTYDLVYTIQTLEHVASPDQFLTDIRRILKPGGRLVIVTDNTDSVDFALFKKGSWGGYHFPRHWYLFNKRSLRRLAKKTDLDVQKITTIVSPVNWVYSLHNMLVRFGAPSWIIARFTLKSPVSLSLFTLIDIILQKLGRGALLNAYFSKPS